MLCVVTARDISEAAHAGHMIEYKWQDISCVIGTVQEESNKRLKQSANWAVVGLVPVSSIAHNTPHGAGESKGGGRTWFLHFFLIGESPRFILVRCCGEWKYTGCTSCMWAKLSEQTVSFFRKLPKIFCKFSWNFSETLFKNQYIYIYI